MNRVKGWRHLRLLGVARHAGSGVEQIARERHLRQHDQHDAVQGSAVQESVAFRPARVGLAVDRLQLDAGHPAARWCSAHFSGILWLLLLVANADRCNFGRESHNSPSPAALCSCLLAYGP